MLWKLPFFLLLQQWFSTISLKGAKSRPTILSKKLKKNYHKSIDTFCFIALTKCVKQNIEILEVLLNNTSYRKESFPSEESDTNLLHSIYFAYQIGIISSYSNRICYLKIIKNAQLLLGSCMRLSEECLGTIVQQVTPRLPATMSQASRLLNQRNITGLQIHCRSLVS